MPEADKQTAAKQLAVFAAIAVLYFLVERTLNECCLFDMVFGSKDLGYKVSGRVGLLIWLAFAVFAVRRKLSFNFGALVPVGLFIAVLLLSTYINGLGLKRILDIILNEMSVLLLMVMLCQGESGIRRFATVVSWVYLFMVVMNVLWEVIPPLKQYLADNTFTECFIGNYDGSGFAVEIGMFWALADDCLNSNRITKIKFVLYAVAMYADVYLLRHISGTTVVGAIVIALFLIFPFVRKLSERINFMIFVALGLLLFAALMWLYEPLVNAPPVAMLLDKVFHKSLTLSGRLMMWPEILTKYIYKKPFLGYGVDSSSYILLDNYPTHGAWHTNNQYLQTWYEGGLIALAVFLLLMVMTAYLLKKMNNRRLAGISAYMIFAFLIVYNGDIQPSFQWPAVFEICNFIFLCSEKNSLNCFPLANKIKT